MKIAISMGDTPEACQLFVDRHWPLANEQQFGWADQGRWRKHHFTLWAEEAGEVIGVALSWRMGGVGYLRQLLVSREQRNRGVGRQLVEAFERECAGCHKLALKTYKDSPSARFYLGLGYRVEAVLANDVHGIDWVYMIKEPGNEPAC